MGDDSDTIDTREVTSRLYGQWVAGQMELRGWNQAMLARRAGLKKQTVGMILKGAAAQPTAWQVASIAHAFNVDPNEVFRAMGLWHSEDQVSVNLPLEILAPWNEMDPLARESAIEHIQTVYRLQRAYDAILREQIRKREVAETAVPHEAEEEPDIRNLAAHPSDAEAAEQRRIAEGWVDEDAP